ncbi:prepilin-type N-terminal cleavage/methylation domain-containing protein [Psychrobacillus sp. FSL W7-1493]|uniref:prepilin-type N-terminal cleavage/methylation domain-containing protein n=1 Tax=Psychrobacillus sp. FSL W7-1493 TaxID=2921552 RepID=UPI0030F6EC7B
MTNESKKHTSKGDNKMKKMKQLLKNQKGLTLVELLAVIVILAIVAAIAVPAIGNIIENSRYNAVKADATNVLSAAQLYFTDDSSKTKVTVTELKTNKYLESEGSIPLTAEVTKSSPISLSKAEVNYSGNKKVTFTNATIKGINSDSNKGSGAGNYTIGAATGETITQP